MEKRRKIVIMLIAIAVVLVAIGLLANVVTKRISQTTNLETLKAMTYTELSEQDKAVDNCEYVEFSAFFARDLDGDGNANKLLGTCKNTSETDTLYLDLNVLTNGYLKNGKITISGGNFKYNMSMVKDDILKNNYISEDVKTIELNDVKAGTQKLIQGNIVADLKNNINNYGGIGTITLTGTHVSDSGVQTKISKTINLNVDWYGTVEASLYTYGENVYYNLDEEEKSNIISINFSIDELNKELLLKDNIAKVTIPDLNGYSATEVTCKNEGVTSTYDAQTKILTLQKSAIISSNGTITNELDYSNTYTVNITYPAEAIESLTENTEIKIPVEGYYVAYNNQSTEFTNPLQSNTVTGEINVIFRANKQEGYIYDFSVSIVDKVYNKRSNNFMISKQSLLELYENSEANKEIEYTVAWKAYRGIQGEVTSVVMNETPAETVVGQESKGYGDRFNQTIIENYTNNKAIYFEGYEKALQADGTISVYNNDTSELIKTFTIEELKTYTKENPYVYETQVKHIRVETTALQLETILKVYNVKQLDTEKILADFTKEEIEDVKILYTYLTGTANISGQEAGVVNDVDTAYYQSEKSHAEIRVETTKIPTQETIENQKIYIETKAEQTGDSKWRNGEFIVEIPEQIVGMEVNTIKTDNENVKISAYELSKVDGKYILKVLTENEKPETYTITVDCTMTSSEVSSSDPKEVNLYAYNQYNNDYYSSNEDIYDVNTNNEVAEQVGFASTKIELILPTKLVTYETITNYNEKEETTYAPNVAEIENGNEENKGTAKVNIEIINNYQNTINGVQILGKIPFEGNKYAVNGKDLNSKFTAQITEEGIELPEELKENGTIYYSENETPSKDIKDDKNGWTLKEKVEDFTKIKTFLIVLDKEIEAGKEYTISYKVEIPNDVNYNLTSYSTHAVYYDVETEEGLLALETEPNKVGIRPVKKFELDLTNYKINSDLEIAGMKYKLTYSEEDNEGKLQEQTLILVTDESGKTNLSELYAGREYKLQQFETTGNYELNKEEIVFTINDNGELSLKGNVRAKDFTDGILKIDVENEITYNLDLLKLDQEGKEISGVQFGISGTGLNRTETTEKGKISITGLHVGQSYTLTELLAEGYYLDKTKDNTIQFKLERDENTKELKTTVWTVGNGVTQIGTQTITENNDGTPSVLSVVLENEKIATYLLEVVKVNEDGEKLNNAEFELMDKAPEAEYNGSVTFYNLQEYVEGKYITGEYTLKETKAPENYVLDNTELKFRATRDENGILQTEILSGENLIRTNPATGEKEITADKSGIRITIENKKAKEYTITKVDEQTGKPIEGAKFAIYKSDDSTYENASFAKLSNTDEYIGTQDSEGNYISTTDENGQIKVYLADGYYKAVEMQAASGYQLPKEEQARTNYFKIEDIEETKADVEINTIEELMEFSHAVCSGNTYEGKTIKLMRTLDFKKDSSYENANDTTRYGDYNQDGVTKTLKEELTSGTGFTPIGTSKNYFSGTFDGNGYEIRNLYMDRGAGTYNVALFGYVVDGKVMNVGVSGTIKAGGCVAGVVSYIQNGIVFNCYNLAEIIDEYSPGGNAQTGGVVGYAYGSTKILNCYNKGNIKTRMYSGGIVGLYGGSGEIVNCYNLGNITSTDSNGSSGIVGAFGTGGRGKIINCYNTGEVTYGIVNDNNQYITNCYYLEGSATKGTSTADEEGIVESKTLEEMQSKEFAQLLNQNKNNIESDVSLLDWTYANKSYPELITNTRNITIENRPYAKFTITKTDEETGEPIEGARFEIYKSEDDTYKNLTYYCTLGTDENGKISYKLPDGYYKAVEVEAPNGYLLPEDEEERTKYFKVEYKEYVRADIEINYIEDLVDLSNAVNLGNTYEGKTIKLMRTLDFNEDDSYRNPNAAYSIANTYISSEGRKTRLTTGEGFCPIGGISTSSYFAGTFDGNGYEIKNLYINRPNMEYVGLFSKIKDGTITNLGITGDSTISGGTSSTGAIVGLIDGGTVSNCYNMQKVSGDRVGGIVGSNIYNGTSNLITNCYNTGDIIGTVDAGGIIGFARKSLNGSNLVNITSCYNEGNIKSKSYAGGIVASINGDVRIDKCYNNGNIESTGYAGGIAGHASGYTIVSKSYNNGNIESMNIAGGILGFSDRGPKVYDSYNLGTISGRMMAAGIVGDGENHGGVNIVNSYNEGTIISDSTAAGIVSVYNSVTYINNCYNIGIINGVNEGEIIASSVGTSSATNTSNCYYLKNTESQQGISGKDDVTGVVEGLPKDYMMSKSFCNLLNENRTSIDTTNYNLKDLKDVTFSNWIHKENKYPTFDWKIYTIELSNLIVENEKLKYQTITKIDEDSNETLSGVKFAIYNTADNDFARNQSGEYIGTKNENGIYFVTTDETGKLKLNLQDGYYKAVEIETIDGYQLKEEPTYFTVGMVEENESSEEIVINNIEDLVDLSNAVNSGTTYSGKTIKLAETLDFNDEASYRSANDRDTYGDYNGDGTIDTIKDELTKGAGFIPIGISYKCSFQGTFDGNNCTIKNIRINDTTHGYAGLFGYTENATIKNIGISGSISSNYTYAYVGGIVGDGSSTIITNCNNTASINARSSSSSADAGGIAGYGSIIKNCYNTGSVNSNSSSTAYAGGIAGSASSITNSYNKGTIYAHGNDSGRGVYTGGIAGMASGISNCYNVGNTSCSNSYNSNYAYRGGVSGSTSGTIKNSYWLSTTATKGVGNATTDTTTSLTIEEMQSEELVKKLNENQTGSQIVEWKYHAYAYPTFKQINFTEQDEITITNKKLEEFTITKVDKDEKKPLSGVKFAIYKTDSSGETIDFAKDANGNYIGTLNENDIYEFTTDKEGKIIVSLPDGYYKAVEIEAADGYQLEENESVRTTYFRIGKDEAEAEADIVINCIEDLVDLSNAVNSGYAYSGKTIILAKDLDFNDESSYRDANDKETYKDYNGDGSPESIKDELTTGTGFKPIGFSGTFKGVFNGNNHEIKNIYINYNSSYTNIGLFGYIQNATISNIRISGNIKSSYAFAYVGGIAGQAEYSSISNCYNFTKVEGEHYVGGIVAYNASSSIINCCNEGSIICNYYAGGIAGYAINLNSIIENCYNKGNVTSSQVAGGIVGQSSSQTTINMCYNTGTIQAENSVGGIAGSNTYNSSIYNSYNLGEIVCSNTDKNYLYLGGVAGNVEYGSSMINCYNLGNVTCLNTKATTMYVGGLVGISGSGGTVNNCYTIGEVKASVKGELAGKGSSGFTNCYYLNTLGAQGINGTNDLVGSVAPKTETFMKSKIFSQTLNINKESLTSKVELEDWNYNENQYPTFATKKFISDSEVTITNKKLEEFTITKVDEEEKKPLSGVKFAIYKTNSLYETIDFATDGNGKYIGTLNENDIYEFTTDENGKITVSLPDGYYKAVEIEAADGYVLEEKESARTTYFKVGPDDFGADLTINSIEDLVELSNSVYLGETYTEKTIKLMKTLDFKDDSSYENPNDTSYGDLNGDGNPQTIKEELTKESGNGFRPIGNSGYHFSGIFDGNGYEIKNLYINYSNYGIGLFGYVNRATITNLGITGNSVINSKGSATTGALVGYAYNSNIFNCYNSQKVSGYGTPGGLIGNASNCNISNCYNSGTIIASNQPIGGIVGQIYGSTVSNCYNIADLNSGSAPAGGITYSANNSTIINCYNTGKITSAIPNSGGIVGYNVVNSTISNCYNAGTISTVNGVGYGIAGYTVTDSTIENCYYKTGSATQGAYGINDEFRSVEKRTESEMKSEEFNNTLNNNKNTINSDIMLLDWQYEENSYPKLSLTKPIKASEVTIENEKMKELIITKVDKDTKEKLSGAEFKIETITEVGEKTLDEEIVDKNDLIGEIQSTATYKFVQNGTTYQSNNTNVHSSVANSYFPLDLTQYPGEFTLTVNASISSAYGDYGYATITTSTTAPSYSQTNERLIYVYGTVTDKDYTVKLNGGQKYYLHIGYYKNSSTNSGSDMFTINSIDLKYRQLSWDIQSDSTYSIVQKGNIYESNNTNVNASTANSYIPIDLSEDEGKTYLLELNASISSDENYDIGYATITTNKSTPAYDDEEGRFVYISGEVNNKVYSTKLEGGKVYYLHLGYRKDIAGSIGNDKFTINDITLNEIKTTQSEYKKLTTGEGGIVSTTVPSDTKIVITETKAPEGYVIENESQTVMIEDENVEVTIENKKLNDKLTITKIDKDTEEKLSGAEIKVEQVIENDGEQTYKEIGTYTTGDDGTVSVSLESNANYRITETKAPNGYIKAENSIVFEKKYDGIEVVIANKKAESFTINKIDEESNAPIQGTKFVIYELNNSYEVKDFAKDGNGNYIGTKSVAEIGGQKVNAYVVTTNENGQIILSLKEGFYKAIEVEAADGYKLVENEKDRTRYFDIIQDGDESEITLVSDDNVYEINYIEDLVDLANRVNNGETFEGKTVELMCSLDFNDDASYRNASDKTTYGDYNGDGNPESIKAELTNTNGSGFRAIGYSRTVPFKGNFDGKNFEIKNLYINNYQSGILFINIEDAKIENIVIDSANVVSSFGGLIGTATNSNINNIKIKENSILNIGYMETGTIIDESINCKIYNCCNEAETSAFGGIVGTAKASTILNCYNSGDLYGTLAGGIVGYRAYEGTIIKNCYNEGDMNINYGAGIAYNIQDSTIDSCYNKGNIVANSGPTGASGIAISAKDSIIINSYNEGNLDARMNASGIVEGFKNSKIINCYNIGSLKVSATRLSVGGISIGFQGNSTSTFENCYNIGELSADFTYGILSWDSTSTGNTFKNCYYLDTVADTGIGDNQDIEGLCESKTLEQIQALEFTNLLNDNVETSETNLPLLSWQFNEGSYPTLAKVQEDNITITNQKLAKVIVHHYKEGTGPEFGNDPVILADDEFKFGEEGEDYTTSPKDNIENYKLSKDENGEDKIPENANGTYTEEEQHVYYYYTREPLKVVVHHYLENTEEKLADDENYTYNEGDHYKVTPSEEVLKSYELVKEVGEEEKDIYEDEEIIYYYKLKEHEIITRVEIPDGRTEKGGEITGEGEIPYETVLHKQNSVKEIIAKPDEGYKVQEIRLVSTDEEGNKVEKVIYGKDEEDTAEISYRVYPDGSVILTQFTNMTEDKEIIVVFAPNEGKVIVHHYIENSTEKIHEDQITKDVIGKLVETDSVEDDKYKLVEEPEEKDVTLTEEIQEKTYYYQEEFKITTNVIEHDEKYKDGTVVENVKGGTITNEDKEPHEAVLKDRDSKEIIEIKPDEGYEIVKVTINEKEYNFKENMDENGKVTLPEGFFEKMQSDKHIEVEFRKKSKVIIKHLEEGTQNVLYTTPEGKDYEEIPGYEGQAFETARKAIEYYMTSDLGITDENNNSIEKYTKITIDENKNADGTMYADTLTIIYWYERIPAGIIVKHIEINEQDKKDGLTLQSGTLLDEELLDGFVSLNEETQRNIYSEESGEVENEKYKNYISVDGPQNTDENLIIVGKDENTKTAIYKEDATVEVRYYYEKQHKLTTEVKPHTETIDGTEKSVDGGTISKEYITDAEGNKEETTYELINSRGYNKKQIEMTPDAGYRIKEITIKETGEKGNINETKYTRADFEEDENHKIVLKSGMQDEQIENAETEAYFKDVQEDIHVIVEFERIPAKVIVEYRDEYTGEIIPNVDTDTIEKFVGDNYETNPKDIENYVLVEEKYPNNSKGTMTEEDITVVYWYAKQFKITTDVIEHTEVDNDGNVSKQKGGSITAEDEDPYELVVRGNSNTLNIEIEPSSGYEIKEIQINGIVVDYINDESIVKEGKKLKIPSGYFNNMQENKHITVEYKRILAIVKVQYLEEGTEKVLYTTPEGKEYQEINGYVNDKYSTSPKQIENYELVQEKYPNNSEGTMTEQEIIVKYYYKKALFNMKIEKEIEKVIVNGQQTNNFENNKLVKVAVEYKEIADTTIEISYKIKVTNTEKVAGTAIIEEYIPEGFEFVKDKSDENWKEENGKFVLQTEEIKPKQTKEYTVTLKWNPSEENKGQKENIAKIANTANKPNYEETTKQDNEDKAIVEIELQKTIQDIIDDVKDGKTEDVVKDIITNVKTGDKIIMYVMTIIIAGSVIIVMKMKNKK